MNLCIFGGRLGRDAELNHVASMGENVCNFTLAVDVGTKQTPKTMWIECALFGKRATVLHPMLKKGVKVTATGRISLDEYTSKQDGQRKAALRLSLNDIDLHLPPRESNTHGDTRAAAPAGGINDDDLPF
jgi:single-strand DNA-binding protein